MIDDETNPHLHIKDIEFYAADLIRGINELSSNSAARPDEFPAFLLKESKDELAVQIFLIL